MNNNTTDSLFSFIILPYTLTVDYIVFRYRIILSSTAVLFRLLFHHGFCAELGKMILNCLFVYHNLSKRGVRIASRAKVNDSIITGMKVIDTTLSIGRGQRQSILGDRYTGKSSIYLSLLLYSNSIGTVGSIDGFGTKRLFGCYISISQNLNKLYQILISLVVIN